MQIEQRVKSILERLVTARMNAGLSQGQAAKLLEIAGSTLSHYEAGLRSIDLPVLLKLCDVYDVSPAWVMTGSNPEFDPAAWYETVKTTRDTLNEDLQKVAALLETLSYTAPPEITVKPMHVCTFCGGSMRITSDSYLHSAPTGVCAECGMEGYG